MQSEGSRKPLFLDPGFAEDFLLVPMAEQDPWEVQGTVRFLLQEGWDPQELRALYERLRKQIPQSLPYEELMRSEQPKRGLRNQSQQQPR